MEQIEEYFKIVFKLSIIIMTAMLIKGLATPSMINANLKISPIEYQDIIIETEENTFKKPVFNNTNINKIIDNYVKKNACLTLDYKINILDKYKVNINIDCNNPINIIYDYRQNKEIEFNELIKNKTKFKDNIKRLLYLKYPTFVVDSIDILNSTYIVEDNHINMKSTSEYGNIDLIINNNEIKDTLNYDMKYDIEYENEVFKLDPNKKTIAFTYDDGPSKYDIGLIDALKDAHYSATFFIVGNRINSFVDSINYMSKYNMEVGSHTYNHKQLTKLSEDEIKKELSDTDSLFYSITGKHLNLVRPPYGSVNKKVLNNLNVPSILWNIDTLDWKTQDADMVYEEIFKTLKDGDIVLMHSLYESTLEATKRAIPELYKQGYQVVSVSELMSLKGIEMSLTTSYRAASK